MSDSIKVLRIITDEGIFFTKDTDRAKVLGNKWVRVVEEVSMLPGEYEDLPITEDAKRFFAGKIVGSRAS